MRTPSEDRTGLRGGRTTPTPARRGKVPLTVYVSEDQWEQFRTLVIKRRSSNQAVLLAAVAAMLAADQPPPQLRSAIRPPAKMAAPHRTHWSEADLDRLRRLIVEHGGDADAPFDARGLVIAEFLERTGQSRTRKAVIHHIEQLRREMQRARSAT